MSFETVVDLATVFLHTFLEIVELRDVFEGITGGRGRFEEN